MQFSVFPPFPLFFPFLTSPHLFPSGVEAIPSEWIERTLLYPQIEIMATRLAGSNPYFETLHEKGCRIGVLLA